MSDKVCEKCGNAQFHTKYKDGKAVAWVCSKCKNETPRTLKSTKKVEKLEEKETTNGI